jgi:hypothetical protein
MNISTLLPDNKYTGEPANHSQWKKHYIYMSVTLVTHSLLPAIIMHLCLTGGSEIFTIIHNPGMKFGNLRPDQNIDTET